MPPKRAYTEESFEEHDHDFSREESEDVGRGTSSSQVRKAQNRIAQREFRQRKQQYIRDLEARVEVLSSDKEDRVELMTLLIRNLLKENKDLRDMVKTMASFVGEGLGSCLPRLGLSAPQLDAILNRADTDTAYDAFLALKASREMELANPGIPIGEVRRRNNNTAAGKRKHSTSAENHSSAEGGAYHSDEHVSPGNKRPRDNASDQRGNGGGADDMTREIDMPPQSSTTPSYAYLFPDLDALAQQQSMAGPSSGRDAMFNSAALGYSGSAVAAAHAPQYGYPAAATPAFSGYGLTIPNHMFLSAAAPYATAMQAAIPPGRAVSEVDREKALREAVTVVTEQFGSRGEEGPEMTQEELEVRRRAAKVIADSMPDVPDRDRKTEAFQVITYHLNNFRVNHSYRLPPSLQPTKVQRTIPHEHAIDGVIFPTMRDRMILLRGRYDLVDVFTGLLNEFRLVGQDALDHHDWEVSEKWLLENKLLVDDEIYAITNKWRTSRGEPALVRPTAANI